MGKEDPILAKIVYVRNKANRKDWLTFTCTNLDLSEEEIICIYGKRRLKSFLRPANPL